ncbi:MAG TPA: hypothetical protein VFI45_17435, partial [Candidatus Acidoferrum sp.]|nr:hypothetical protein [Candidatus Acidoferrum sp.]
MLRLKRIFQNYEETGSLNERVNLYGFIDSHVFLTKTGDLGLILEVAGVDYECLDQEAVDGLTKRLESALKLFDENYRVYQYLFKRNSPAIPHKLYGKPVVDAAIASRIAYLAAKSDTLFSLAIYYVVVFEGFSHTRNFTAVLSELPKHPGKTLAELFGSFSARKQIVLLERQIADARAGLERKARSFLLQVSDFLPARILEKQEAFAVLKRTLNFAIHKLELAKLRHDTFLDWQLAESHLECHRGYLR